MPFPERLINAAWTALHVSFLVSCSGPAEPPRPPLPPAPPSARPRPKSIDPFNTAQQTIPAPKTSLTAAVDSTPRQGIVEFFCSEADRPCSIIAKHTVPWGTIYVIIDDTNAPDFSPIYFILDTEQGAFLIDTAESESLSSEGSQTIVDIDTVSTGRDHARVSISFRLKEREYEDDGYGYQAPYAVRNITYTWLCGRIGAKGFGCRRPIMK